MNLENLKKKFSEHCIKNNFEENLNQIKIIELLYFFFNKKKKLLDYFLKPEKKLVFYLYGNVGVGKTMILNFFYNHLTISKQRLHFNEFMINFHDFRHENKNNSIEKFVKKLKKKYKLIYFDEFQVTNIVDAMILGKLFRIILKENIKVIITSNIKISDLYKDGLQRDQFLPFISIIRNFSIEKELLIKNDYRKSKKKNLQKFYFPLNAKTNFKVNQLFREITKDKKKSKKTINVKGRKFVLKNYFDKIARFNFNELCKANLGGEDFINISKACNCIFIEKIPNFTNENSNAQQRFITLIDIIYENKIPLILSAESSLEHFTSSSRLKQSFKRTISRIYELTSIKLV